MTFDHLRAVALMPELGAAWPLAFVLADMLFQSNGKLFPSIDRLCVRTGFSRAQVKRHLAQLRKLGVLVDTGERYGRTGRIHAYELDLPALAALRKRMQARIAEAGLSDDRDTDPNRLTDEPISQRGNGLTHEPIDEGKWAHLLTSNGLICSSEMGSPVSHISSKSKQKKQTGVSGITTARDPSDAQPVERETNPTDAKERALDAMKAIVHRAKEKP